MKRILEYLADPQPVADLQHWFGVEVLGQDGARQGQECQASASKRDRLEHGSGRPQGGCSNSMGSQCGLASTTRGRKKCHARQDSAASDASSSHGGGSGSWWMNQLLGENTGGTEGSMDESALSDIDTETRNHVITNRFWYHLFHLATGLGGELFYSVFFCFWAWNVDGAVLRRVIVVWMITMYIGQALKDLLKVERPASPPVVRLDPKWQLEYGLPSTHAIVGATMPFSLLILSLQRYQLDWTVGLVLALCWCLCVCLSRLYLGMHSILDVLCGLVLASGLLVVLLPWVDVVDHLALTHPASPLLVLTLTVALVVCYPATDRWTPARGDTTVIVGVGCGNLLGSWANYQLGVVRVPSELRPPYPVLWPSVNMVGLSLLRTCLGMVLIVAVRAIFKSLSFATVCALLQVRAEDYHSRCGRLPRRHRLIVELSYKFITYIFIGITVAFTAPYFFRIINIERPTFYTEV